jgi:hypothetical protein
MAECRQVVSFEGKRYLRRFAPARQSKSGTGVSRWSTRWEEVEASEASEESAHIQPRRAKPDGLDRSKDSPMRVTPLTRGNIVSALTAAKVRWSGRLNELEFLSRLYELQALPSTDQRYQDAASDIWQHRINSWVWDDDWVFYDKRLRLLDGEDDVFLRFLCEMLHPMVRADTTEVTQLRQLLNGLLSDDGFRLERKRMSDPPVFVSRYVGPSGRRR